MSSSLGRLLGVWLLLLSALVPRARRRDYRREWWAELDHALRGMEGRGSVLTVLWRARLALLDAVGLRIRGYRAREDGAAESAGEQMTAKAFGGGVMDARLSWRSLLRRPAFFTVAVLTLALGIGANTAVFSVLDAVLLRPLPFAEPERLAAILPNSFVSNDMIDHLRREARSWAGVASVSPGWLMALTGVDEPVQVNATRVTGNLFAMLGVRAAVGEVFGVEAEVAGSDRVVVLGHALWLRVFSGDAEVIGRSIALNGVSHRIVGVAPRDLELLGLATDIWTPLAMDRQEFTWTVTTGLAVGRLRPDVTVASAAAELQVQVNRMREVFGHPDDWRRDSRVEALHTTTVGGLSTMLWLLMGAVAFVLLIACANVANLMLVRAQERRHELAVRRAIGAGPFRVLRLFMFESAWLSLIGGATGFGLAWAGVRVLRNLLPADMPRVEQVSVDGRVLLACVVMTTVAAATFAVVPCIFAFRESLGGGLRSIRTQGTGASRTRGLLIAVEVALAVSLVVGATLMARTTYSLARVDPGFRADNLLTLRLQPSGRSNEEASLYWSEVLERIRAVPGVLSAATVLHLPFSGRQWVAPYQVEGRPIPAGQSPPRTAWQAVSPDYFETAGIPLLRGRPIVEEDLADGLRVGVINTVFARIAFPDGNPIGQRINAGNATGNDWTVIVGVAGAVRHDSLTAQPDPELYVPFSQSPVGANSVIVRTAADPLALAPSIAREIRAVDANVPIAQVMTMGDLVWSSTQRERMVFALLGAFAVIGMALGMVGIHGVVAYSVRQRVREIGIRMALGARRGAVSRLLVGEGMVWALLGIAIGVPAAFGLTRLLQGLVFGVSPTDPATFVAVPIVLAVVAAFASWVPARRAARIPPTEALRE
jgi:predicted permease